MFRLLPRAIFRKYEYFKRIKHHNTDLSLVLFEMCNSSVPTLLTLSKPKTCYMYRQFNIQQFYVLPTQCICVFYVDLRTNSDYFSTQL